APPTEDESYQVPAPRFEPSSIPKPALSETREPVLSERSESKGRMDERPFASPPRPQLPARREPPRTPRGDGLLTPQELAAAFQLELAPSASRAPTPYQPPKQ